MHLLRAALLFVLVLPARAQDSLDVTFRFLPDLTATPVTGIQRVFVPGTFNGWGPNSSGVIAANAPSLATRDAATGEWRYTARLRVGSEHMYKINVNGTASGWTSDPLNPRSNPADNNNSVLTVADPMVFQLAREQKGTAAIVAVSASIFSTAAITSLTFEVNGAARDGLPYFTSTGGASGLFRYELPSPAAPGSFFKITATDARGRVVKDSIGIVPPKVVDAPRPAGLQDGITYGQVSSGKVTLSLFAPYKQYVYVIGDFNGWRIDDAYLMKRDSVNADSVYFWLELDGLTAGVDYGFQYLVDGLIRVADPYSELVLDPIHDNNSLAFRPRVSYPTGKTTEIVGVLYPPEDEVRVVCEYERPDPEDLVLYELLLRDFQDAHSFTALRDTLDYLQKLGVTAIELMPVSEFDGNLSWGYNPAFHFAVDKYYGSAQDLRLLVDEAHCRGMAVILDVVYNHATGQSPLVRLWNTSATGSPSAPPTAQNPYANTAARHPFNVFNDLNHDSPATRYWLDRANRYWLETFGVDGFRYDLSKGFTQCGPSGCLGNQGRWDSYDASRIYNLKRMADEVWSYDPDALLILEHLSHAQEERELATYRTDEGRPGFLMWRKMMGPFNEATMGYHDGGKSNTAGAYFGAGGQNLPVPNAVSILEDHDEQRLMRKNARYGATGPAGYDVKETATSLQRMKAAGALFFPLPGPKMIWQFGELGYGAANDECLPEQDDCPGSRTGTRANGWKYRNDPDRYRLYQTWAALIGLRKSHPVFTSPQTQVSMSTAGAVKRVKLSLDTMQVVIVGNLDVSAREAVPDFHATGTWYDFFGRGAVEVADASAPLVLEPGAFRVFTSGYLGYAPPGLVVDVEEGDAPGVPQQFALGAVRPNPVRDAASVRVVLPQAGEVRLDLYDALGRRVAVLADGYRAAGTETIALDVSGLSAGLYVLRLSAGAEVRTQPLIVVR